MKSFRFAKIIILCILLMTFGYNGYGEIKKGENAPVFNLRNTEGILIKPFQEPKLILISFFFTECPNCVKEIKDLEELNQKYNDKVSIFLVGTSFKKDVDISEDVDSFIKGLRVNFVSLVDKYKDVIKEYGVSSYPAVFLINSNGKVIFTSTSYNEKTISNLEKQIKLIK